MQEFKEQEFEKCVLDAIKSGDFMEHVQQFPDNRFAFSYIPYREMTRLKERIRKLEEVLDWYSNGNGSDWMESNYDEHINSEEEE